jgi:N-acetylglucosamine-6-sulfatase
VDRNVGAVVRQLQDLGLLDRTVVVIASDHGEAFREHGFEGHARDVYQEVAGTPWIISLPFALEPGVVVDQTVANIDIWPTVLDLVGLPPLAGVDGRSAVPLILASQDGSPTAADRDRPIFAHLERNWARKSKPSRALVAVTQPPYRLIYDVAGETVELYDHSTDPGEMRDEAVEHPEVAARMRAEADGYLERGSQQALEAPRVEVDELRLRQLIALGYAVEKED